MSAPPMASRLVNVAEDAELRLISLLGEYSTTLDVAQCEQCSDASRLFQLILADKMSITALVTQVADNEEAAGGFALLVALINDDDSAETQGHIRALAQAVVQAGNDNNNEATCARKMRLLSILYNLRAPVADKVEILRQMILVAGTFPGLFLRSQDPLGNLLFADDEEKDGLAVEGGKRSGGGPNSRNPNRFSLQPSAPRVVQLLDSWQVGPEQRFALYQAVVKAFETTSTMDIRKQRFLLLMVDCGASTSSQDAAAAAAKEAAIGAIRDPISLFAHQRNLLNAPSIQALSKTEPVLFGLLKIFQEGKLSDYDAFLQGNGGQEAVLSRWGLDPVVCRTNMRILSLCSLASEHEEIPYPSIAETLQIEKDDSANNNTTMQVEAQVIAAVNSGLLQAKMDQLSQKVLVERCVVRQFDIPQWKTLQERLRAWKDNVGTILVALEQAQASAAPSTSATPPPAT